MPKTFAPSVVSVWWAAVPRFWNGAMTVQVREIAANPSSVAKPKQSRPGGHQARNPDSDKKF